MSSSKSSISQHMLDCPVCHLPIQARLSTKMTADWSIEDLTERALHATVELTGMRLEHDCTPKVLRSQREAIGR